MSSEKNNIQANKKIKITIVINDFMVGGAQKLIIDMLTYADRNKFDYELVTLFLFEDKQTFYDKLPSDIPLHKLSWSGIKDIKGWLSLIRILKQTKPDVVISHLFFSNTITRILKIFMRYKVIIVEHNTYVKKTGSQILIDRILSPLTFRIIAVSNTVAMFTAKQENIPKDKFVVIKNGINMQAIVEAQSSFDKILLRNDLGFREDDRIILNVGRLTDQKNQMLLVEAFGIFVKKYPFYKLIILGEGPQKESLIAKIEELRIKENVLLLGVRSDVFKFYAISDFLTSASKIEGLSIAYLEALAFGLPILATVTAGTDELIQDGYNGHFIKKSTIESTISGILYMHEVDIVIMQKNAKLSSEKYNVEKTIRAYETLSLESLKQI